MFRTAGGHQAGNLYSPAGASDSSGFSEQRDHSSAFSPGHSSFTASFRPGLHLEAGRSLSPQIPHSYHNPTLMASPYSTLPRRPGSASRGGPPTIMATTLGRNSPLFELTGASYDRSSSLGRNNSLVTDQQQPLKRPQQPQQLPTAVSVRTPLLDDDRESCV
jgi:hypothetical protein